MCYVLWSQAQLPVEASPSSVRGVAVLGWGPGVPLAVLGRSPQFLGSLGDGHCPGGLVTMEGSVPALASTVACSMGLLSAGHVTLRNRGLVLLDLRG